MRKSIVSMFLYLIISMIFVVPITFSAEAQTNEEIAQSCGLGNFDVKDSLIGSVITLCLPGVLENVNEYKQLKCQRVVCHYDALSQGLDSSFCDRTYAYQTCTDIVGEVFNLPFFNVIESLKDAIAEMIANPIGIAVSAGLYVARQGLPKCYGIETCNSITLSPQVFLVGFADIASGIQYFKELGDNAPDIFSRNDQSYCERLPAIKEELKNIQGIMITNN